MDLTTRSSPLNATSSGGAPQYDYPTTLGTIQLRQRYTSDGLPNTENGAPWLRLEYDPSGDDGVMALDFSFYGFGSVIRFTGDNEDDDSKRSVLEFWGADQVGPLYRPILTMVVSSAEHEVHVARNISDTDAIICDYPISGSAYYDGGGPVIWTAATVGSTTLDLGVQRVRLVRVAATGLYPRTTNAIALGLSTNQWTDCFLRTSLRVGATPAAAGDIRLRYGGDISSRNSTDAGDINLITSITINSVVNLVRVGSSSNGVHIQGRSAAAAPTTSDLPAGFFTVWRDTAGGTTKLYYNHAGAIQSVALA